MVQALPDSPEALKRAARAAGERGAWDKGARYAAQAAELEPLDRETGDLLCWVKLGKARKHFAKGETDKARRLYEQMDAMPHRTGGGELNAWAEAAAFFDGCGQPEAACRWRDAILDKTPRPWVWAGHFLLGRAHLFPPRRGGAPSKRRPADRGSLDVVEWLNNAPSGEELSAMLVLTKEAEREFSEPPHEIQEWLDVGLAWGAKHLSDEQALQTALQLADAPVAKLAVAEAGARQCDDPRFVVSQYGLALDMGKPPEYFASAVGELSDIRERLIESLAPDPLVGMVTELLEQVRARTRNSPRKRRAPARKRTVKTQRNEGQQPLPF
jgi:hypothetical protein